MTTRARRSILSHFEYLKHSFLPGVYVADPDPLGDDDDEICYFCPIPGVANDIEKGIQGGFLKLTENELIEVFRLSFDTVTNLTQQQISTAEGGCGRAVRVRPRAHFYQSHLG